MKLKEIILFLLFTMNGILAYSQSPDRTLNVGIFIYPGVEVLDFTGPSEVFGSTQGFKPFIVAFKKEPIKSQGFITVTPEYSIKDCPPTDILVFPGGGTGSVMNEPEMIAWLKERSQTTQFMMSVCTGAGLLSKAGLLDGLEVTTFHGYINELQSITPKAKVLTDTRFVDNGHVITTAGVSAGTDGALHLVSRIKGEAIAWATAHYMEYDKWQPNMGLIKDTPFIASVRKNGLSSALKLHQPEKGSLQPMYYDGEMTGLAKEMLAANPKESAAIYEWLIKSSKSSTEYYDGLRTAWLKMGKSAPSIDSKEFQQKLVGGDFAWAKQTYQETTKSYPEWQFFTEEDLNNCAYQMLLGTKKAESIPVFKWVTELYPSSANAWDSLSEAHELIGNNMDAIAASKKCLETLPKSGYEEGKRATLERISRERIAKLENK